MERLVTFALSDVTEMDLEISFNFYIQASLLKVNIGLFLTPQASSSNLAASQGPATSESNNLPVPRPSSGSALAKAKGSANSKSYNFADQTLITSGSETAVKTKADLELLAQNRGNAMLRYKEKKKNRRCLFVYLLLFSFQLITACPL